MTEKEDACIRMNDPCDTAESMNRDTSGLFRMKFPTHNNLIDQCTDSEVLLFKMFCQIVRQALQN